MREFTNEESLDMFADMLEPFATIYADPAVKEAFSKDKMVTAVAFAIKSHKPEVIKILAASDGEPVETYKVRPATLPVKLLRLFSSPDIVQLFMFAGQMTESGSSGSATESTEERGE